MSFSALKKNRGKAIDKLRDAAKAQNTSYSDDSDKNTWKPTRDKAGNGFAVIRFLPAPEGEELPWIRYWDHGFEGPTGLWYIENSLTTLGQDDPVSEYNSELWNSGNEEDKEIARKQKRRLHYVANILVISDPSNPEMEGKVMHYVFGKKIFDKIMDVMQPEFEDETPINPFDFWEGADFKVKVRKVDGWVNYDKSEFAAPAPLFGGDEAKLEEVYNKLTPLSTYTDPSNYKSYDELKKRMEKVLGLTGSTNAARTAAESETAPSSMEKEKTVPEREIPSQRSAMEDDSDEDDALDYFKSLAANNG